MTGVVQTICRTGGRWAGATWNDEGVILFSRFGSGVLRVRADGGEPEAVTTPGPGDLRHALPEFLPGGRLFLYVRVDRENPAERSDLVWRNLDSAEEHVVRAISSRALYSPTGHLVFRAGNAQADAPLVAQRFDPSRGEVSGELVQLAPDVWTDNFFAAIAVAPQGVLAYRARGPGGLATLTWLDRQGKATGAVGLPGFHRNPSVDRDGTQVLADSIVGDVVLFDAKRRTSSRLTFDSTSEIDAVFSPDGQSVAFHSNREPAGIYQKPVSGVRAEALVAATGPGTYPRDWSADGRFLLYDSLGRSLDGDVWVLSLTGADRKPMPYLTSPATEQQAHFSPDVKWVAYVSDELGRPEIFVQDFPASGAKYQVSTGGGSEPRWRRDGRELYYLDGDGWLTAVHVETGAGFRFVNAKRLFQTQLAGLPESARRYGVSPDGQRFLMNVPANSADTLAPVTVVLSWTALLKQ